MLKIRRPLGRLIFNMGIAIPGKTVFLIETAPSPIDVDGVKWYFHRVTNWNTLQTKKATVSLDIPFCIINMWRIYINIYIIAVLENKFSITLYHVSIWKWQKCLTIMIPQSNSAAWCGLDICNQKSNYPCPYLWPWRELNRWLPTQIIYLIHHESHDWPHIIGPLSVGKWMTSDIVVS